MRVGRVVATIGLVLAGLIAAPTAFAGAGTLTSSTTTITSTSPNAIVDEPISVSVNVSGSDGGIPTGTVTVSDGTNTSDPCTLDSSGDAICAITETSAGPETLTANYSGDGNYDVSSSSTSVSVADLPAVLVTGDASGPDVSVGDVLTENVTFDDSPGYNLGACAGTAEETVVSNPESPGTATLNLTRIDFTSCTGTSTIAGITDTTLTNAATISITNGVGGSVSTSGFTLNASTNHLHLTVSTTGFTGSWSNATSAATFNSQSVAVGTSPTASVPDTDDWNFGPIVDSSVSGSPQVFETSDADVATDTIINSVSPANQVAGGVLSVGVSVSGSDGGIPTGTVTISDGTTLGLPCTLDASGNGICTFIEDSGGPASLTATYGGDGTYEISSSAPMPVVLEPAVSTTTITSVSPDPAVNRPISVGVNVAGNGGGMPSGTVTLSDGTNSAPPCVLDYSGNATCSITETQQGPLTLTATYSGNVVYPVSSASTSVTVGQLASTTTITSTTINPAVGQQIAVGVSVAGSDGEIPTGSVTVSDGTTTSDPCALDSSGDATCTITRNSSAQETLTVAYSGDDTYTGSAETSTVNPVGCVGLSSGTYIGSFGFISGIHGSDVAIARVTGNTYTMLISQEAGRSVVASGITYTGGFNCTSVWGSGPLVKYLFELIHPNGSMAGTLIGTTNNVGWVAVAPESVAVSDSMSTSVTTGSTVTNSDPIQASISSPTAGPLSISTADQNGGVTDSGYQLFGPLAKISAETTTDDNPMTLTMTVSGSTLDGQDPSSVVVFENGSPAAQWCPDDAPPISSTSDPCEVDPPTVNSTTGAVTFTVLTTQASVWTIGARCKFGFSPLIPSGRTHLKYQGSFTACGGKKPWKFSSKGALPKGLTMNTSGVITGTPSKTGTYHFSVTLTDSSRPAKKVSKSVLIKIT